MSLLEFHGLRYNVVMDGKRYEIRADLQCTLSEKGATIKFNLSNQKKMQIAVQEASKSIFKHHKEINQILDNIKLLSQTSHIKKYCESLILRAS